MAARNEMRRQPARRASVAWRFCAVAGFCALSIAPAWTQAPPEWSQVLDRLDRLETQNRELAAEVRALRSELAAAHGGQPDQGPPVEAQAPPVEDRLEIQEGRTAELAETKVEAAHRLPLLITGMALFNAYFNSNGGGQYPTTAASGQTASGGATFRQSIIGLDYSSPRSFVGGKVTGSLRMDLFGRSTGGTDQLVRLRTASLAVDWENRGFLVGIEKPLISPREPDSLAQVGISPLSGAGNLYFWLPQARFTQDFKFGASSGVRAQLGVVQTHEVDGSALGPYELALSSPETFEAARPGVEARLEFFHGADRRIEIAPAIHHSVTHIEGASVPSDVYSADWLIRFCRPLEFTGEVFTGRNVAPLGTGAIRQGLVVFRPGLATPVHTSGGWGQLTYHAASRLWFNFFSGQQDDRNSDVPKGGIGKNLAFGANVFFRLAPNVLASFESSRTRTTYIGSPTRQTNHYDLAFAYLF